MPPCRRLRRSVFAALGHHAGGGRPAAARRAGLRGAWPGGLPTRWCWCRSRKSLESGRRDGQRRQCKGVQANPAASGLQGAGGGSCSRAELPSATPHLDLARPTACARGRPPAGASQWCGAGRPAWMAACTWGVCRGTWQRMLSGAQWWAKQTRCADDAPESCCVGKRPHCCMCNPLACAALDGPAVPTHSPGPGTAWPLSGRSASGGGRRNLSVTGSGHLTRYSGARPYSPGGVSAQWRARVHGGRWWGSACAVGALTSWRRSPAAAFHPRACPVTWRGALLVALRRRVFKSDAHRRRRRVLQLVRALWVVVANAGVLGA